jgi:hypothetical protein
MFKIDLRRRVESLIVNKLQNHSESREWTQLAYRAPLHQSVVPIWAGPYTDRVAGGPDAAHISNGCP